MEEIAAIRAGQSQRLPAEKQADGVQPAAQPPWPIAELEVARNRESAGRGRQASTSGWPRTTWRCLTMEDAVDAAGQSPGAGRP